MLISSRLLLAENMYFKPSRFALFKRTASEVVVSLLLDNTCTLVTLPFLFTKSLTNTFPCSWVGFLNSGLDPSPEPILPKPFNPGPFPSFSPTPESLPFPSPEPCPSPLPSPPKAFAAEAWAFAFFSVVVVDEVLLAFFIWFFNSRFSFFE